MSMLLRRLCLLLFLLLSRLCLLMIPLLSRLCLLMLMLLSRIYLLMFPFCLCNIYCLDTVYNVAIIDLLSRLSL